MLTFAEVCAELRLSPKTVRKHIVNGDLAAVKVGGGRWGGSYRISEQALEDFVKRQAVEAAS